MQSFNHALEEMRMKFHSSKNLALIFLTVGLLACPIADATEADDTTIDITGQTAGSTPFIPPSYQAVDFGLMGSLGVEIRRFSISFRAERSARSLIDSGALPTSPLDSAKLWTISANLEYLLRVL